MAGDREQGILDAALKVFFKKGYKGATTKVIAREAGCSELTLFNKFKNKKNIYEMVLLQNFEKLQNDFQLILAKDEFESPEEFLQTLIKDLMKTINDNFEFIQLVINEKNEKYMFGVKGFYAHLAEHLEKNIQNNKINYLSFGIGITSVMYMALINTRIVGRDMESEMFINGYIDNCIQLIQEEKHAKEKDFLSQAALELEDLSFDDNIYEFIAKKLNNFVENSIVTINTYDEPSNSFQLRAASGEIKGLNDFSRKTLGLNLLDIQVPANNFDQAMDDKTRQKLYNGGIIRIDEVIYQIFNLPQKVANIAKTTLNIGDIYGAGFKWNGKIYGTVNIFMKKGTKIKNKKAIETFVSLASVALQRRRAEEKLKQSLEEKEMLLKEIHHRVKNNLTIMSSLLNLESRYIEDVAALDVFKESQNRAKSMALVHERLYQSNDLKHVDFGGYIRTLTTDLYHSMVSDPSRIQLNIDVEDVKIDIDTVVPMGLIVNELLTNSMKYAFPDNQSGYIKVELYRENEYIVLKVNDNGVGFPEDVDFKNTSSLGLQLIKNLVMQIDGEIELDRSQGTAFALKFKERNEC